MYLVLDGDLRAHLVSEAAVLRVCKMRRKITYKHAAIKYRQNEYYALKRTTSNSSLKKKLCIQFEFTRFQFMNGQRHIFFSVILREFFSIIVPKKFQCPTIEKKKIRQIIINERKKKLATKIIYSVSMRHERLKKQYKRNQSISNVIRKFGKNKKDFPIRNIKVSVVYSYLIGRLVLLQYIIGR